MSEMVPSWQDSVQPDADDMTHSTSKRAYEKPDRLIEGINE
eukprot:CAMPEP_0185577990 /NCGR_PEP_ID=MMETSP0434-20130131/11644_1 /TAXON_ID=626734 ORGANISM="Favella taraikaensis, Strain Fe Narragansett Bay" /NCGR_SAMPLE_ID=MMETSP0434 /ASSEMBLY_ACC=CAM_ASM_000379 /LENGTH=40 /DNA_ID= /DNA_START= /DNA_END= /DNA_ORIENTATION=